MTQFQNLLDRGMRAMEAVVQEPKLKIAGVEYPGDFSEAAFEDVAGLGGFEASAEATYRVRKSAMATRPKKGTLCTRAGVTWKIGKTAEDSVSFTINLHNPASK